MRKLALTSTVLAALLALTACSSGPADSTAPTSGASTEGSATDAAFPRTIEHAMGSTEIPAQPKRIVALDASFVDATLLLESEVVGFTTYRDINGELPAYLGSSASYGKDAVDVGTLAEPNLEAIIDLQPDLIISAKVRHEALYGQLSNIAPTVMTETTGPSWKENLELAAQALGKEDLAKEKLTKYETDARTMGERINAGADNPEVSVVRFVSGPTRLYALDSFSGIVLQDAGIARTESQDVHEFAVEISEEQIALADGDKIFVATSSADTAQATHDQFTRNPLWQAMASKVVDVPDLTWMTSVGVQGAYQIFTDMAKAFDVEAVPNPFEA